MDLINSLQQITSRIPEQLAHLLTEEATKNALVLPLINALGYNVFDPTEVVPEFTADMGTKKGEKVDYVIMRDGKPAILIECKSAGSKLHINHASQLFRYFSVTDARFAILTNGIDYRIYTDIEAQNKMDEKPFFEFSMLALDLKTMEELRKFSKTAFDLGKILSTASELKYKKQIQAIILQELESPSEDFVRHFARQVYSGGVLTPAVKSQFTVLVGDAFRDFIKNRVSQRIQSALDGNIVEPVPASQDSFASSGQSEEEVITTDEEREGFQIVRAILSKHVKPSRIVMRDTKSYCGVLLDDNNRKPICRLRFNFNQKYLGLFDEAKQEEKIPLGSPVDIFFHEERLVAALAFYEPKKSSMAAPN